MYIISTIYEGTLLDEGAYKCFHNLEFRQRQSAKQAFKHGEKMWNWDTAQVIIDEWLWGSLLNLLLKMRRPSLAFSKYCATSFFIDVKIVTHYLVAMNIPCFCVTSRILRVINCHVKLFLPGPATGWRRTEAAVAGGYNYNHQPDLVSPMSLVTPRTWLGHSGARLLWQILAAINNKWFGAINIFSPNTFTIVLGTLCL